MSQLFLVLFLFFILPIPVFFAIYFFGAMLLENIFDFISDVFHNLTKRRFK